MRTRVGSQLWPVDGLAQHRPIIHRLQSEVEQFVVRGAVEGPAKKPTRTNMVMKTAAKARRKVGLESAAEAAHETGPWPQ